MFIFNAFPNCCSLVIAQCVQMGTVEEFVNKHSASVINKSLPVLFTDNELKKEYSPPAGYSAADYKQMYGVTYVGLGGHKLAAGLREMGYRVDEIATGNGNHDRPVDLWIWWPVKNSKEGKKPSRINYVEQKQEKDSPSLPGPAKRTRTRKVTSGMARLWSNGLRRVAK